MRALAHCVIFTLTAALGSTRASASFVLSVGSETVAPTGTATVDLSISGLTPGTTAIGTYDVNVVFNSSVVSFSDVGFGDPTLGDLLDPEGHGTVNAVTLGTGTVEVFELSLDDPAALLAAQPANFTLATLTFNALAPGASPLSLSINALGDQNGNSLTATAAFQNGSITVSPSAVPLPATAWLLLSGLGGLGGLGFVARKRDETASPG